MGLLEGKTGLVLNIANDRSIATYIATKAIAEGATCGFGFLPMDNIEKSQRRVRKAMQENGFPDAWLHPCDVSSEESIESFFAGVKKEFGRIDFLVHSLAFANRDYLRAAHGVFTSTPREVFKQALDISAYSLIALARAAQPLMDKGGSIIAMTYLGAERAVPGYNIMGVAKAALEASARYLALDLGNVNIRVNTVSAGPLKTLSAMAVGGIEEVFHRVENKAPLKRNIDGQEVANTAIYLLSDLSSAVTGENIFVDCGFNISGL